MSTATYAKKPQPITLIASIPTVSFDCRATRVVMPCDALSAACCRIGHRPSPVLELPGTMRVFRQVVKRGRHRFGLALLPICRLQTG